MQVTLENTGLTKTSETLVKIKKFLNHRHQNVMYFINMYSIFTNTFSPLRGAQCGGARHHQGIEFRQEPGEAWIGGVGGTVRTGPATTSEDRAVAHNVSTKFRISTHGVQGNQVYSINVPPLISG